MKAALDRESSREYMIMSLCALMNDYYTTPLASVEELREEND
jgi:hypothetical protein